MGRKRNDSVVPPKLPVRSLKTQVTLKPVNAGIRRCSSQWGSEAALFRSSAETSQQMVSSLQLFRKDSSLQCRFLWICQSMNPVYPVKELLSRDFRNFSCFETIPSEQSGVQAAGLSVKSANHAPPANHHCTTKEGIDSEKAHTTSSVLSPHQ